MFPESPVVNVIFWQDVLQIGVGGRDAFLLRHSRAFTPGRKGTSARGRFGRPIWEER